MQRRTAAVTMHGNPLTLVGNEIKTGDSAPEFQTIGNDMASVKLSDYKGRVAVVVSVPSLDTPVCDIETRRFNNEAANLSSDVAILTISMDLPFAQKRWCGAAGVENLVTLSDHKDAAFGMNYGVLIEELRLLARAIFVIDRQGVVRYRQLVREISQEPNYDAVLAAIREVAG